MWDWLKADWVKALQPRILFALWFVGAVLLFAPGSVASRFGFTAVVDRYRGWIGIITVAAFALWVIEAWLWWYRKTQRKGLDRKQKQETLQYLHTLSEKERFILMGCLACNQQTINLSVFEKAGAALRQKGLLVMASFGDAQNMPHTIPDFVWDELNQHTGDLLPSNGSELETLKTTFRKFDSTSTWRRSQWEDW